MGMKTLTNEQVGPALVAVQALQAAKASGSFKMKLARIAAVLREDLKQIQEEHRARQLEHVEKDEAGQPKKQVLNGREIDGTVVYKDYDAWLAVEKEFLAGTVELDLQPLTEKEIDSLEFEGSIEGLLPLLTD